MAEVFTQPTRASTDADELRSFGYKQELRRSMKGFSSFAISFSLISIITGIFGNFGYGLQQVGPSILWSWAVVGLGQLLVALVMADLSTRFPISGYGYQWTSRLTNPHLGYFVGWLLLMQFVTGFPAVCQALADTGFSFAGGSGSEWTVTWITVGVITLITLIHLYGIKLVARVNDMGVYAEITGAVLIIMVLFGLWMLFGTTDISILLDSTNAITGEPATFSAFALSLLMGAWCLTGFEAAADLAEETHQPRKTVPRAVITSFLGAAIGGFLMIFAFLLSIDDVAAMQQHDAPLIAILTEKLGSGWTSLVGVVVVVSILACGVACMATATRLIYSLARDNMLPFSRQLSAVHAETRAPRIATIVVWAIACVCVIAVRHLELISSISAVAGYLGYTGIMLGTLLATRNPHPPVDGFSLGRWRTPIRATAIIWTLIVVAALTIPPTEVAGMTETHLPAKSTLVAAIVGIALYIGLIRPRILRKEAGPPTN